VDNDRAPRGNILDPASRLYTNDVPTALLNYITALRSNKVALMHVAELLEATAKFKDASGKETELASGVGKEELPVVLDRFTTTSDEKLSGLLNVNTASAAVLQTLPGIEEGVAQAIVAARRSLPPEKLKTPAWVFQENLVPADVFKTLAQFITTRSWQYSFNVIGFGLPSGRYRVFEVTIDVGGERPRVTYLRDVTRRGLPFRIVDDGSVAGENERSRPNA
jgi:hypothetical protein